jgi:PAS domain S-box-containing protein
MKKSSLTNKSPNIERKLRPRPKKEDFLDKKLMVVLFRWITILIVAILIFYKKGEFNLSDPAVLILLFLTLTNGVLSFFKPYFFEHPKHVFLVLLTDIVSISFLFRFISSENQLYLVFFAVIFISSISQNVKWSLFTAMIACVFYLSLLTFRKNSDISVLISNPEIAIQIPFIFLVALWTSFWGEQYKKKKEEEETIQQFSKQLEEGIKIATKKQIKISHDLKRMKEHTENILRSLNSGVIVVDNNGIITSTNPQAESILAVESQNMVGNSFNTITEFEPFHDILFGVLKEKPKTGIYEVELKNGKTLNMTFSQLKESKKKIGATVVFQDITAIKEMKEKVRQSESLANLGKTVAWIAHEIKNMLTNVMGYTQLISMKYGKNGNMKLYLDGLLESTERINILMVDILDFSRERKIKREEVIIDTFLKEIVDSFSSSLNGSRLIIKNDNNIESVISNHEALRCVISNLIKNAKEAIDENGGAGKIELNLKKKTKQIVVEISDTGNGIEKEKIKSVFNPFFTTKKEGTGLGLSIVKKIVESLDGKISVTSKLGKGSKFRIVFPVEEKP